MTIIHEVQHLNVNLLKLNILAKMSPDTIWVWWHS